VKKAYSNQELEKVILKYWPQINFRVRRSLGNDNSDWEDVAADILMDAIQAFKNGKFRGESSAGTFIYVITSRRIIDYLRKKYKKPRYYRDADWPDDPFDQVKKNEESRIIWDAIKRLKPRQTEILYLYYYMELTQREIGEIFGLSTRRINELLSQSRDSLREIIKRGRINKASSPSRKSLAAAFDPAKG